MAMSRFPHGISSMGIPLVGAQGFMTSGTSLFVDPVGGAAGNSGKDLTTDAMVSIATAYAAASDSKNDVIYYLGGSTAATSLASSLTWSKSFTHMIGISSEPMFNSRARLGHSADFSPMITMSGSGNLWRNLYFMYGRGSATNLNLITISGSRNSFVNVHFGAPMHATEAGEANLRVVTITGQENYFNHCTFGIDTIARGAANSIIETGSGSARNVFEDCIFLSMSSATTPFMIRVASGSDRYTIFRNCMFINFSQNWGYPLAYLISKGTTTSSFLIFDSRCMTYGVTDIVAAARVGEVWWGGATNTSNVIGLAINPAES